MFQTTNQTITYDYLIVPGILWVYVGITRTSHPFGNGVYQLSMVMTGGCFIVVIPTLLMIT